MPETAIAETQYHSARLLAASNEPAQEINMRVNAVDLDAALHDLRAHRTHYLALYHLTSYLASRALTAKLRTFGADGIRYLGGECAYLFRPRHFSHCRLERHLCSIWNASAIAAICWKRQCTLTFNDS